MEFLGHLRRLLRELWELLGSWRRFAGSSEIWGQLLAGGVWGFGETVPALVIRLEIMGAFRLGDGKLGSAQIVFCVFGLHCYIVTLSHCRTTIHCHSVDLIPMVRLTAKQDRTYDGCMVLASGVRYDVLGPSRRTAHHTLLPRPRCRGVCCRGLQRVLRRLYCHIVTLVSIVTLSRCHIGLHCHIVTLSYLSNLSHCHIVALPYIIFAAVFTVAGCVVVLVVGVFIVASIVLNDISIDLSVAVV